jgi:hypothetical protein
MNDELERIWKETLVAEWRYDPGIRLYELRNVTMAVGVPTVILTEDLPITSLEYYRCDNPLGKSHLSVTVNRYIWHDRGTILQHSFLRNGRETDSRMMSVVRYQILDKQEYTAAARERLGKHFPAARALPMIYKKTTGVTK